MKKKIRIDSKDYLITKEVIKQKTRHKPGFNILGNVYLYT